MNDEALERIETKIAFLEHANAQLSDVVFSHQRLIDSLRAQVATLETRMQASNEPDSAPRTPEEERPPHY
jgi:SlyX protein